MRNTRSGRAVKCEKIHPCPAPRRRAVFVFISRLYSSPRGPFEYLPANDTERTGSGCGEIGSRGADAEECPGLQARERIEAGLKMQAIWNKSAERELDGRYRGCGTEVRAQCSAPE